MDALFHLFILVSASIIFTVTTEFYNPNFNFVDLVSSSKMRAQASKSFDGRESANYLV